MLASGLYRCSGCSVVFEDPRSWREAGPEWQAQGPPPARPPPGLQPAITPAAPDLSRYGLAPNGKA